MIYIDSNKHLINYNDELSKKLRISAEKRRELYHYCSVDTACKILESKKLLFRCINKFTQEDNQYERKWVDKNYRDIIFISCMTYGPESEKFWKYFADNDRGVRLTFKTKDIFHKSIIDCSNYIYGYREYNKTQNYIAKFTPNISVFGKMFCNWNTHLHSDIVADIVLTDVHYDDKPLNSINNIEDKKYLNLSTVSRTVTSDYQKEYETRMISILRSTKEICIENIDYLLVPLNFNNFNIDISYGRKTNEDDRLKLELLKSKYSTNLITNENM